MIDRAGFFQTTADDEQRGDGERGLISKNVGHFPGIDQAERDDEAEHGKRDDIRCGPFADEGDERDENHCEGEADLKSHGC